MAHMNGVLPMNGGFEKHTLDEDAFGPKGGLENLKSFDAFPKTKATYTSASSAGGQWTIALIILCTLLTITELRMWWRGTETHHFSVERGVGHELQLNLDIIIAMPCKDLHVNVQDAAMDRILAGDLLSKDDTNWEMWTDKHARRRRAGGAYKLLHEIDRARAAAEEEDTRVGHVLGHMREGGRKFDRTPRLRRWETADSCRIFGSLEGNKVQGDFHITARGHGYTEFGAQQHLDHSTFNFSHHITELSFGPHYPHLLNPLDRTSAITEHNFFKFQYYMSIVPTIYTQRHVSTASGPIDPAAIFPPPTLDPAAIPQPPTLDLEPNSHADKQGVIGHSPNRMIGQDRKSVFTNQYAATSQNREVGQQTIPGVFFKYDIEPILLIVSERRGPFLGLVVRLVNVISGVLVGGGWMYQLVGWAGEVWGRRRRGSVADGGVLHGRSTSLG